MPSSMPASLMSSATSTEGPILRPWQFFLLAGMLAATAAVVLASGQSPASIVILSLTVVAAGLAGLGAYHTVLPIVSAAPAIAPPLIEGRTRAALEREKTLALRSIKELEFDFAMGKVAKADFDEMSERLRRRATRLLRQLDEQSSYRTLIEQELQKRLAQEPPALPDVASAAASAADLASIDLPCQRCGSANDSDARFCKNCGTKLESRPV